MLGITEVFGIAGFFIGSGGLVAALISIKKAKHEVKKIDVESDSLLAESARKLLEPLNDRIDEQDKQIQAMIENKKLEIIAVENRHHTEMEDLKKEIETLTFCKDEHVIKFQMMDVKIKTLQDKNNKLINGINILINQLKLNGQCPMWQPTADDCETLDGK